MKKIFISIIVSLITSISVAQSSYRGFVNTLQPINKGMHTIP